MVRHNENAGIEFKDFNLAFHQATFLCSTLKCFEFTIKSRIPFIKSRIPTSNLGFMDARNPLKFAAWKEYLVVASESVLTHCYDNNLLFSSLGIWHSSRVSLGSYAPSVKSVTHHESYMLIHF